MDFNQKNYFRDRSCERCLYPENMNSETKHIPRTETFRSDFGRFRLSDTITEISGGLKEHQFSEQSGDEQAKNMPTPDDKAKGKKQR